MVNRFDRSTKYTDRAGLTIFLSSSLVAKAKLRGINIAESTEKTLEYLLAHENSTEMIALAIIDTEIKDIDLKIQKQKDGLASLDNIRKTLEQRRATQQAEIDEIHRALSISQEIKALNLLFLETNFDLPTVKEVGKETIAKLVSLGFEITDDWLARQAQRVRLMKI